MRQPFLLANIPYQADLSPWLKVIAQRFEPWPLLLLDSNQPEAAGPAKRFDLLFFDPSAAWRVDSQGQLWQADGDGGWQEMTQSLTSWLAQLRPKATEALDDPRHPELPRPGIAGYLSYDFHRCLHQNKANDANASASAEQAAPLFDVAQFQQLLIMDHQSQQGYLWHQRDEQWQWLQATLQQPPPPADSFAVHDLTAEMDTGQYQQAYDAVQRYLRAGDCYQINLTYRYFGRWQGCPFAAYQASRAAMGGPFSGFWQHQDLTLGSLSPERFVQIEQGRIESRPIKGTIARGQTPQQDLAHKMQLANSEKDQAENLMIVDLLRNDLGKLAKPGSVRVPELFAVESYRNVHHLVSAITATLRPDISPLQALISSSPGGSITGAPKKRAMAIISELELSRRGSYCGSLFYWDSLDRLDSSILIRTWQRWHSDCQIGTGGGVTLGSTAQGEHQESQLKVAALLACLMPAS